MSALACSPQPAGSPMPTPCLLPQVQAPEFATTICTCRCIYWKNATDIELHGHASRSILHDTKEEAQVQSIAAWSHIMYAKIKRPGPCCYRSYTTFVLLYCGLCLAQSVVICQGVYLLIASNGNNVKICTVCSHTYCRCV